MIDRGAKCRFYDDDGKLRRGAFLEFVDGETSEYFTKILADDTKLIVVVKRSSTFFDGTFFKNGEACNGCAAMEKSTIAGVCIRGERLGFMYCRTLKKKKK